MTDLDELVADGVVTPDVDLSALTTYRLGGRAKYLAEPTNQDQLMEIVAARAGHEVLVLGRGSNLVVSDDGFEGIVVRLGGDFEAIEIGDAGVTAGGAAWLPAVARESVEAGHAGLEFYVGIPGTVGGAVRQNAGGHGSETREWLQWADLLSLTTGDIERLDSTDLEMSYRHTNIQGDQVVMRARFHTERGDVVVGRELVASIVRWRKDHQPPAVYNAGSVFRNPLGHSAGQIIDELGLKGFSAGGVRVSEKHANFFVADPGATASDLYELVQRVRQVVRDRRGIDLEPEVQFVGRFE